MHIITKRAITESWKKYPDTRSNLAIWEERMIAKNFISHKNLKEVFPNADYIPNKNFKHLTIFNIKGNEYRLAVDIFFNTGRVYIKWFGKHAAYDQMDFTIIPNRGFILC